MHDRESNEDIKNLSNKQVERRAKSIRYLEEIKDIIIRDGIHASSFFSMLIYNVQY